MWTEDTKKWQEKKVQKVVSLHSMKHGWIICKSHSVLWINFIMLENLSGSHKINSASTLIRSSIVSSFWALFTSFFSHHVFLLFFIFIHNTQQSSQTLKKRLQCLKGSLTWISFNTYSFTLCFFGWFLCCYSNKVFGVSNLFSQYQMKINIKNIMFWIWRKKGNGLRLRWDDDVESMKISIFNFFPTVWRTTMKVWKDYLKHFHHSLTRNNLIKHTKT